MKSVRGLHHEAIFVASFEWHKYREMKEVQNLEKQLRMFAYLFIFLSSYLQACSIHKSKLGQIGRRRSEEGGFNFEKGKCLLRFRKRIKQTDLLQVYSSLLIVLQLAKLFEEFLSMEGPLTGSHHLVKQVKLRLTKTSRGKTVLSKKVF